MTNFGASFRKARESKGVSLEEISAETRVSTRFLSAIENEEFHLLPGGIFNRGFVRAYAEEVGLDPEEAVADYERLTQVSEPDDPFATTSAPQIQAPRGFYPIALGLLVLVILIFYVVTRDARHDGGANPPTAPPSAIEPPPATPQSAPAQRQPNLRPWNFGAFSYIRM
jgi:cytoskeleton protein RodZ